MLQFPTTSEQWASIQRQFFDKWNFPQCLGALDGKHVRIKSPMKSGSKYFNYMHYFSVVLLALVDADYKFIFIDVGTPGRYGDATIWNNSQLRHHLQAGTLPVPPPVVLPGCDMPIPSLIVADSAFALHSTLMKPYPEKNMSQEERLFNYRLCRARRVVENAFGILASRFGLFQCAIGIQPQRAVKLVLACLAIHNFLRTLQDVRYCVPGLTDTQSSNERDGPSTNNHQMHGLNNMPGGDRRGDGVISGREVRDALKRYFVGPGAVSWQMQKINN